MIKNVMLLIMPDQKSNKKQQQIETKSEHENNVYPMYMTNCNGK